MFAGGHAYEVEFAYGPLDFEIEAGTVIVSGSDLGEVLEIEIGDAGIVAKKIPGFVLYPTKESEEADGV